MANFDDYFRKILKLREEGRHFNEISSELGESWRWRNVGESFGDVYGTIEDKLIYGINDPDIIGEELRISPEVVELYLSRFNALKNLGITQESFPILLKKFREEREWSHHNLALAAGASQSYISDLENGKIGFVDVGPTCRSTIYTIMDLMLGENFPVIPARPQTQVITARDRRSEQGKGKIRKRDLRLLEIVKEKYSDYVPIISEAIIAGLTSKEEFEEYVGLRFEIIKLFADYFEDLSIQSQPTKPQKIDKKKLFLNQYLDYIPTLSEAIILGLETRREYEAYVGLDFSLLRKIARRTGIELHLLKQRVRQKEIDDYRRWGDLIEHNRAKIDEMLCSGIYSLEQIGSALGITHEPIRRYKNLSGQDEIYREARKRAKQLKHSVVNVLVNPLQNLLHMLTQQCRYQADKEGYGEAVEYYFNWGNKISWPLNNLVDLVHAFKEAEENGDKLSYKLLADKYGFNNAATVRYVLRDMGFTKPLTRTGTFDKESFLKREEALKRAFDIPFTAEDFAFFLGYNPTQIKYSLKRIEKELGRKRNVKHYVKQLNTGEVLTFTDLSMIYETSDLGGSIDQICGFMCRSKEYVEFALTNRYIYEPNIVLGIIRLKNNIGINTPY